jgi:hypothetical protein
MNLFFALIMQYSSLYGVDPKLVSAVIQTESAYNVKAVGPRGEIGLMQLLPSSFPNYTREQLFDPKTNLKLGIGYLAEIKSACPLREHWVICFNTGVAGAKNVKNPSEHKYYKKINSLLKKYVVPDFMYASGRVYYIRGTNNPARCL